MQKREMEQFIREKGLKSYHVTVVGKGEYALHYGRDDPAKRVYELEMELDLVKSQFKYAMELAFKRNPDLAARYGHLCPYQKEEQND